MKDDAFYLLAKTIISGLVELSENDFDTPMDKIYVQFAEGERVSMDQLVDMFHTENNRRRDLIKESESSQPITEMRS